MSVGASIAAARAEREASRPPLTLRVSGFDDLPGVTAPLYVRYGRVGEDRYADLRRRMSLPTSSAEHVSAVDGDRTFLADACKGIFLLRDGEGRSPVGDDPSAPLPTFADRTLAEWLGVDPNEPARNRVKALYEEVPAEVAAHARAVLRHSGLVASAQAGQDADPFATS